MTFTKEINKEMEKVMMLMDMGILPFEDKDGVMIISAATEEEIITDDDHYEHTLEKNRRAERRRQLHKHKKATVNGKTVKAYGKEGKFWLNNDERIAYGKQLINGKFIDDVKEAEILAEAMVEFMIDEDFAVCEKMLHDYDDFEAAMEELEELEEELFGEFAERGIFVNYLPSNSIFERFDSLEWAKKFKDFLSLEEVLEMFF